jgi:hypothetical protein
MNHYLNYKKKGLIGKSCIAPSVYVQLQGCRWSLAKLRPGVQIKSETKSDREELEHQSHCKVSQNFEAESLRRKKIYKQNES